MITSDRLRDIVSEARFDSWLSFDEARDIRAFLDQADRDAAELAQWHQAGQRYAAARNAVKGRSFFELNDRPNPLTEAEDALAALALELYQMSNITTTGNALIYALHGMDPEHDVPCSPPCEDEYCAGCAMQDCPHREPLHRHHDGCPACSQ
jgi:hypothetical protein